MALQFLLVTSFVRSAMISSARGKGVRPRTPPPVKLRGRGRDHIASRIRSEEHTSELQSLMRISYAVFCLKKKTYNDTQNIHTAGQHIKYQHHKAHTVRHN